MEGLVPAGKGKRFAAGIIDLVVVPIFLGVVIELALFMASDAVRNIVLIFINVAWLIFRDAVWAPGRAMIKTRVISLLGGKVTLLQSFVRNIFLIVPFVLSTGYVCEIARLLISGSLLGRRIAYGITLVLVLAFFPAVIAGGPLAVVGLLLALIAPIVFLVLDKEPVASGRLADILAKNQVVEA